MKQVSEGLCSRRLWGSILHTSTTKQHDIAKEYLGIGGTADSDSSPLALCNPHYQHEYRALRFPLPFAACATQLRYGRGYTPRCPNLTETTRYLQQMVDLDRILSSDSHVTTSINGYSNNDSHQPTPTLTLDDRATQLEGEIIQ